jgi:hypothetical protein
MFQGTLEETSITDILEILAQGQKRGLMVLDHKDLHREFFVDGKGSVTYVESNAPKERLDYFLATVGGVRPKHLAESRNPRSRTGESTGIFLLNHGYIDDHHLKTCLERQFQVTLTSILAMKRGTFRFTNQEQAPERCFHFKKSLQSLMMEGLRIADEYSHLVSLLGGWEQRYLRRRTYGATFQLRSIDIEVLSALSEPLALHDCLNLYGYSDFGILQSLKRLWDQELIEQRPEVDEDHHWPFSKAHYSQCQQLLVEEIGQIALITLKDTQKRLRHQPFTNQNEACKALCQSLLGQLSGPNPGSLHEEFEAHGWFQEPPQER